MHEGHGSGQARQHTDSCTRQHRSNNLSESDSMVLMNNNNSGRKAGRNRRVSHLNCSDSDSHLSSQRARFDNFEMGKELKIISPVSDCYKNALDFRAYRLLSSLSWYDRRIAQNVEKLAKCLQLWRQPGILGPFGPQIHLPFPLIFQTDV